MARIVLKRIPNKLDKQMQRRVINNMSSVMIETYKPKKTVEIVSAREIVLKDEKNAGAK